MSDPSPLIGLRLPWLEAAGKITGRSEYTDDLSRPRMLAGAILGSPYPHARIVSYDVASAELSPADRASFAGAFTYSITSSAMASSVGGTVRPSIRAVWALMTSSNLLACTTGRSAGFAPLRMWPA